MSISAFQATSFIGRRRELGDLHRALASSRSVTLVGIGGAGKTRLAQCLLEQLTDDLRGRVWTVELGQVRDPELVQLAVATAMGLRPQPGQRQVEAICTFLGDAPALLVLDNCEHLLGACSALASDLLSACPGAKVVATSRQPLGIAGELVYRVPPLSVPDVLPSSGPGRATAVRARDLADSESVDLFVGRAGDALPGFELTDDNAESVARLCMALEGIPLALELAAARIRVLSPAEMLDRIEQRYRLLGRGYVDVPDRQRSMEASVEWSHDLCNPQEQLLWARLSVFSGGFDLDAAEIVCSDDELPADAVLDVLSSLVDKSLVSRDPRETQSHFHMLETIRLYGEGRLASTGDTGLWRRRHRDHFARLARQFHESWVGRDQPRLMEDMRRNHANLRSVLEQSTAGSEEAAVALRMAVDLEEYWAVTGLLTEGRHWLDAALLQGAGSAVERAVALSICGYLAAFQSQPDEASRRLVDARAELTRLGPEPDATAFNGTDRTVLVAWSRYRFAEAVHAVYAGDLAGAEESAHRSIDQFEAAGEVHGLPAAYVVLGVCLSAAGRRTEAAAVHARGLAMTEPRGELHIRGLAMWALSVDARRAGDLVRAAELARLSLDLRSQIGDDAGVALAIESLASIAAEQGDATRSATLLGAAVNLWDRVGLDPLAGQYVAAQREAGERAAREQLQPRAFNAAHRRGRTMPVEEVVDYALDRSPAPAPGGGHTGLEDTPLTSRERQVAALIGEGLSNQQIATRLVISVRTAQGHVENILRKLGFRSRTQVAAWVVSRNVGGADRLPAG